MAVSAAAGTSVSGSVRGGTVTATGSGVSSTVQVRVHAGGVGTVVAKTGAGTGGAAHAGGAADGWATAERATDCSRLTLETIVTFLTASQATSLLLEVGHAHGWESGGGVVLRLVLVNLVDGHGGVDNRWLDRLFLDDWLNGPDDMSVRATSTRG